MTDKRYQVFISSTYEDLKEERRAVQDTLINMGDFPVQMESFPATDEGQLEYIKPLIEACDYYILIIGGRYGSLLDDGKSYTEKEFLHAVETGVPVIVLVHSNPEKLPRDKTEETPEGNEKLEVFKHPAFEIANIPNLPDLQDTVEIEVYTSEQLRGGYGDINLHANISGTWLAFFIAFHRSAKITYNDWNNEEYFMLDTDATRDKMGQLLANACETDASSGHRMTQESFTLLESYFIEAGLFYDEGNVPFPDLAKKIIRRLTIAGLDTSSLKVTSGEILLKRRMDDDEIPF